jgi:hypothetical protein
MGFIEEAAIVLSKLNFTSKASSVPRLEIQDAMRLQPSPERIVASITL